MSAGVAGVAAAVGVGSACSVKNEVWEAEARRQAEGRGQVVVALASPAAAAAAAAAADAGVGADGVAAATAVRRGAARPGRELNGYGDGGADGRGSI